VEGPRRGMKNAGSGENERDDKFRRTAAGSMGQPAGESGRGDLGFTMRIPRLVPGKLRRTVRRFIVAPGCYCTLRETKSDGKYRAAGRIKEKRGRKKRKNEIGHAPRGWREREREGNLGNLRERAGIKETAATFPARFRRFADR